MATATKVAYWVVCSFSGGIYSRHRTLEVAERAAEKMRQRLRHPNCGSLASNVRVVPANSRFTRIIPANNEFGCVEVSQATWVTPDDELAAQAE